MSAVLPWASNLTAADMSRESIGGMDVIFTPAMRALATVDGQVQEVEVAANGMTRDMIPESVVDAYMKATLDSDGVVGYSQDGVTAVLLDRLAANSPQTALDSATFAPLFAQQTGGLILARVERVSVVPPPDRLRDFGMVQARLDLFMQGDRPAAGVTWSEASGLFKYLSELTGRQWGFPDELEHQVAGLAGRDPREFPFPTRSGTREALPYEAHYGQPWDTGVTLRSGNFPQGPWGHRDMAGQLWEWMQQLYRNSANRIVRGGSWDGVPDDLRSDDRDYSHPDYRDLDVGLRGRVGP